MAAAHLVLIELRTGTELLVAQFALKVTGVLFLKVPLVLSPGLVDLARLSGVGRYLAEVAEEAILLTECPVLGLGDACQRNLTCDLTHSITERLVLCRVRLGERSTRTGDLGSWKCARRSVHQVDDFF